jgi:tetratricopeptide (TPR) repeat protein
MTPRLDAALDDRATVPLRADMLRDMRPSAKKRARRLEAMTENEMRTMASEGSIRSAARKAASLSILCGITLSANSALASGNHPTGLPGGAADKHTPSNHLTGMPSLATQGRSLGRHEKIMASLGMNDYARKAELWDKLQPVRQAVRDANAGTRYATIARSWAGGGKEADAAILYEKAANEFQLAGDGFHRTTFTQRAKTNFEAAAEHYAIAAESHAKLADAAFKDGKSADAAAAFKKAADNWSAAAKMHQTLGNHDKVVEAHRNSAALYSKAGDAFVRVNGMAEQATGAYRRSLEARADGKPTPLESKCARLQRIRPSSSSDARPARRVVGDQTRGELRKHRRLKNSLES